MTLDAVIRRVPVQAAQNLGRAPGRLIAFRTFCHRLWRLDNLFVWMNPGCPHLHNSSKAAGLYLRLCMWLYLGRGVTM